MSNLLSEIGRKLSIREKKNEYVILFCSDYKHKLLWIRAIYVVDYGASGANMVFDNKSYKLLKFKKLVTKS